MNTYEIIDNRGRKVGVEVENIYIGIGRIVKLLKDIEGVSEIITRRLFGAFGNGVHVWFKYRGEPMQVVEPFQDNASYWIIRSGDENIELNIDAIEQAFSNYRPPMLVRFFGDLLTSRLFGKIYNTLLGRRKR
ncbi:MAG: hypothetical protein GYA21_12565 [Myxococcales bacterium]|nr:hypothetical protein [Myxococcales bacterium]